MKFQFASKNVIFIEQNELTEQNSHRSSLLDHSIKRVLVNVFDLIVLQVAQQPVKDFVFVHQIALVAVWLLFLEEDDCWQLFGKDEKLKLIEPN